MDSSESSRNDEDIGVSDDHEPEVAMNEVSEPQEQEGHAKSGDALYVQKRLKQQKRAHEREVREMQARIAELQSQMSPQQQLNNYAPESSGGMDETITKAVSYALSHRDEEERKARAAQASASLAKHYHDLQKHLDTVSDKYDDFDEVVRGDHIPYTETMRDAALMLPKKGSGSAGEVLYKLGKNPEELNRISKLYPHEQATELVALSQALASGGEHKESAPRPLGQIKHSPVSNSNYVNEKTPVSSIRDRMKKGLFK